MTDTEIRETIRQMLTDWDSASPEERADAIAKAEASANAVAGKWTVVRTVNAKGRFVYTVNGVEMQTAKTKYALATVGTGNPYRNGEHGTPDDGFYLSLSNSYTTVRRTLAQFPQMILVDIQEG